MTARDAAECSLIVAQRRWNLAGSGRFSSHSYLGLPQQLLQLVLGQQTVVLHKSRDLGRSLGLIIHCAVNLHVPVQNLQEILLALLGGEKRQIGRRD